MKVQLMREKESAWRAPATNVTTLTLALPFFRSTQGTYVHRVRSGKIHHWRGEYHHTAFKLWCGQLGFLAGKLNRGGELFSVPPETATFCATCEGRAIGAGQDGSRMICGRIIKFSPHL